MTIPTAPRTHSLYHASEIAARAALRPLPAIGAVLTAVVAFVVVTNVLIRVGGAPVWAAMAGEAMFVVVPAAWIAVGLATFDPSAPPRMSQALGFRRPAFVFVGAAVLIGASQWLWNMQLANVVVTRLPVEVTHDDGIARLVGMPSLPLALLAIAIVPALTEEVLFRGVLTRALGTRFVPAVAIVLSAFAFAAFHVSLVRFVPTFTLGLVYGFLALRARSAIPSMIAHLVNNLVALLVGRGALSSLLLVAVQHEMLAIVTACGMTLAGLVLIAKARP